MNNRDIERLVRVHFEHEVEAVRSGVVREKETPRWVSALAGVAAACLLAAISALVPLTSPPALARTLDEVWETGGREVVVQGLTAVGNALRPPETGLEETK